MPRFLPSHVTACAEKVSATPRHVLVTDCPRCEIVEQPDAENPAIASRLQFMRRLFLHYHNVPMIIVHVIDQAVCVLVPGVGFPYTLRFTAIDKGWIVSPGKDKAMVELSAMTRTQ